MECVPSGIHCQGAAEVIRANQSVCTYGNMTVQVGSQGKCLDYDIFSSTHEYYLYTPVDIFRQRRMLWQLGIC
jgi:hypothetical protein